MRLPTVLIADDHRILTDGLVSLLKGRFDVVGTVADGQALIETAERLRPDVPTSGSAMSTRRLGADRARDGDLREQHRQVLHHLPSGHRSDEAA